MCYHLSFDIFMQLNTLPCDNLAVMIVFRWSITPMMYPASFVFNEPSTAYIFLIVSNLFIGITCIITSFLLEMFQLNSKVRDDVYVLGERNSKEFQILGYSSFRALHFVVIVWFHFVVNVWFHSVVFCEFTLWLLCDFTKGQLCDFTLISRILYPKPVPPTCASNPKGPYHPLCLGGTETRQTLIFAAALHLSHIS